MSGVQSAAQEPPLQSKLREDVSGDVARNLLNNIAKLSVAANQKLRETQPQEQYRLAEQLVVALDAGERIVRDAWRAMHGRSLT